MTARCDFCGRAFAANAWNQRTCVACECRGAPDQSKGTWEAYLLALKAWLKAERSEAARRKEGGEIAPQTSSSPLASREACGQAKGPLKRKGGLCLSLPR